MKKQGFTLIELLVVISVIAVLMAILMPALNMAKRMAATGVCLSNTKNLALGWYMYMQDNDGKIMSADDNDGREGAGFIGWIGIPRDAAGNMMTNNQTAPVTDEDEIRGIKAGMLFPYMKDPKTYHCPSNTRLISPFDGSRIYVGYSIPMCLNGYPTEGLERQIKNYNKITDPATRYVFVENTEARNWTQGHHFLMGAPEYTSGNSDWGWWSPMSINHGGRSVLSFCDGHSELRIWRDKFTIERVDKLEHSTGGLYGIEYPPDDQQSDITYMAKGWAFRYFGR